MNYLLEHVNQDIKNIKPYSIRAFAARARKFLIPLNSRCILFSENILFDSILSTDYGVIMPCYELSNCLAIILKNVRNARLAVDIDHLL